MNDLNLETNIYKEQSNVPILLGQKTTDNVDFNTKLTDDVAKLTDSIATILKNQVYIMEMLSKLDEKLQEFE